MTQAPLKLDFLTKLTKINFPALAGPLLVINVEQGGNGIGPLPALVSGLPFGTGNLDISKGPYVFAKNGAQTPKVVTQPSKAMLKDLLAWSTLFEQSLNFAGDETDGIPPAFSQSSFLILNPNVIQAQFPDWKSFTVSTSALQGAPANPNQTITYYIVYEDLFGNGQGGAGGPFLTVNGQSQRWFVIYGNYSFFPTSPTYQQVWQQFISGITGGGTSQEGAAGFSGQGVYLQGTAATAASAAGYFNSQSAGDHFQVYQWNLANPSQGQEADAQIVTALYDKKSTQNFNQEYLIGSDTFQWFSPPPPKGQNRLNVAPNGPVSLTNSGIQFQFGSLPSFQKKITLADGRLTSS